jgi:Tfp pilus assembly protein PilF
MRTRILFVLLALSAAGCAALRHHEPLNYKTITAGPNRDTERATKENECGLRHLEHGQLQLAERAFQQALIADVTYGPAHNHLGQVYFQSGELYLAAWEFEYAIKLMPERPEPSNNLGLVYETVGKLNEAIVQYESAYAMQPENPEFIGNLARARLRRGDRDVDLTNLVESLLLYDTRPEWIAWANDQLALGNLPPGQIITEGEWNDADREVIPPPRADDESHRAPFRYWAPVKAAKFLSES